MKKHRKVAVFIALIMSLLLVACGNNDDQGKAEGRTESLTIGIIPTMSEGNMKVAMDKLEKHLQDEVGIPVELDTYSDYNGVVEAMNFGDVNLAYLGPLTYVIAHHESGAEAIMTQLIKGEPYYYAYFIAHKDSPYDTLDDLLENKEEVTIAFGDPSSTSGSLIPGMELKERGVYRSEHDYDFKNVTFTGGHDATSLAVQNKGVDAGGVDSAIFDMLVETGKIDGDQLKVIWQSEKLFQYPWAVKDVDQETITKIQDAFLKIEDQDILDAFGATGFTKASNADYEAIKQAAEHDGRLK
ncbi:phosphonate ABC transporter substrate-binding protein [Ammoniphilus oxalaticus]|uniref:Phosphonate ABC transporter substrate-binding protein n=1 Tax=Ammoniphilus oxalaticus TaxID=66863 RepID=A0A419SJB4_9BACL|nr:phosphate/phosphite/phosphonate ABC transporter substrate-binding protein [Ammoniphilus oxalaticus]RKD24036.1 phosphonate ABC transporter substrate-binding protein [Ammoniphilus oxalaticus]